MREYRLAGQSVGKIGVSRPWLWFPDATKNRLHWGKLLAQDALSTISKPVLKHRHELYWQWMSMELAEGICRGSQKFGEYSRSFELIFQVPPQLHEASFNTPGRFNSAVENASSPQQTEVFFALADTKRVQLAQSYLEDSIPEIIELTCT